MNWKALVAALLVLSGFGASGFLYLENGGLKADVSSLNATVDSLHIEIRELNQDVENLTGEIETLEAVNMELDDHLANVTQVLAEATDTNEVLSLQVVQLEDEVGSLQESKTYLEGALAVRKAAYDRLESSYDTLQDDFLELEQSLWIERELRIGNSLECYYDTVREGLGPTGATYWWYTPSQSIWQTEVEFAANLAQHDLWRVYWPDLEGDYEWIVGENSYEMAYRTLTTIVDCIGFSGADTVTDNVSRVLGFLSDHIHYEYDVNDVFLAPVETLDFKSGDCDDYSILASALLECVGVESAIGFFRNDIDQYHAMVLVRLDDLGGYGCYCYEDLTEYGLSEGRWIMVEPQLTIDGQLTEWMEQWNLLVACELVD